MGSSHETRPEWPVHVLGETLAGLAPLPPSGKKTPAPHPVPMLGTLRTARFLVAPVSVQLSFSSFSPVCSSFAMTEWAHSGIRSSFRPGVIVLRWPPLPRHPVCRACVCLLGCSSVCVWRFTLLKPDSARCAVNRFSHASSRSRLPILHHRGSIEKRRHRPPHSCCAFRIPTPAHISIRDTSFAHPLMHPIFEIGLSDGIDFSKPPSPQQQRRRHPHLVSAGPGRRPHQRTVRLMASSHHSSPIRPTSPTTHESSPPRRRPRSSPKAKPVGGPGAFAGNAGEQNTAEREVSTRLSLRRLKQGESHQRVCREKVHEPTTIAEPR